MSNRLRKLSKILGEFQCDPKVKSKTLALNIGFSGNLIGVASDLDFYKKLSKGFSDNVLAINDNFVKSMNKEQFLNFISNISTSAENIFFNYAGHGLSDSGSFSMVLPNVDSKCVIGNSLSYRGLGRIPENGDAKLKKYCDQFFVSAEELTNALHNKPIFGFIDSCFAGSIKNAEGVNVLYSSKENQLSEERQDGGFFTNSIRSALSNNPCSLDLDKNGILDFKEFSRNLPPVFFPIQLKESSRTAYLTQELRGLSRDDVSVSSGEKLQIVGAEVKARTNEKQQVSGHTIIENWTECYQLKSGFSEECKVVGSNLKKLEVTGNDVYVRYPTGNANPKCKIHSGNSVGLVGYDRSGEYANVYLGASNSCEGHDYGWVSTKYLRPLDMNNSNLRDKGLPIIHHRDTPSVK